VAVIHEAVWCHNSENWGVARLGQLFQPPQAAGSKGQQNGQQIEYFKWEKFDFQNSTNFKLLV
jgi:hypothetical protein